MRLTPTDFPTVSDHELRELWRRFRDPDVRRLILEVHRARAAMRQVHADALDAQLAIWHKEDGELKAKLQHVIDAMLEEKVRLGVMGGSLPKD
ncbi:hypothetical protein BN2476_350203 [Paraburkholderia piptadeniae]|uniref:Uncharacterized protein n=1 Tax=Paraburkholderia piptadeniae TaxID=1701573 RepID=A0A1N7S8D8_9BURK|nr:hypothetical protein [Paraburkholderia piptadeniae]SIT43634.1 hypothetical protein BN2476_350203 [Paraburkholderia piptadeniae]